MDCCSVTSAAAARAGRVASEVLRDDALVDFGGVRLVAGSQVAIRQIEVAIGLRQFGVVIAQELHGIRGSAVLHGAGLQNPASAGERRTHLAGVHRAQFLGDAVEVFRFHPRRSQIVGGVIGDGRELRLRLAQGGDRRWRSPWSHTPRCPAPDARAAPLWDAPRRTIRWRRAAASEGVSRIGANHGGQCGGQCRRHFGGRLLCRRTFRLRTAGRAERSQCQQATPKGRDNLCQAGPHRHGPRSAPVPHGGNPPCCHKGRNTTGEKLPALHRCASAVLRRDLRWVRPVSTAAPSCKRISATCTRANRCARRWMA